jgi:hypothetical protein
MNNIKKIFREVECEAMIWTELAQDPIQLWVFAKTEINLRVPCFDQLQNCQITKKIIRNVDRAIILP